MNPPSRFPKLKAARLGSVPQGPEEELRFVQDRVALLGKITFFISGTFMLATVTADAVGHVHRVQLTGRISHGVGTLIALVMWQTLSRPRTASPTSLLACDLLGTFTICASFVGMGHFAVQPYGYYTAMLAVTHVSITRAMVVPSEWWQAAAVSSRVVDADPAFTLGSGEQTRRTFVAADLEQRLAREKQTA